MPLQYEIALGLSTRHDHCVAPIESKVPDFGPFSEQPISDPHSTGWGPVRGKGSGIPLGLSHWWLPRLPLVQEGVAPHQTSSRLVAALPVLAAVQ